MKKAEIDNLFKSGKKSYGKILKVVSVPGSGKVVISAPIKIFKRAVDRNRVKRLIREALKEVDFSKVNAFVIYNIAEIKTLDEIKNDLKKINKKHMYNGNIVLLSPPGGGKGTLGKQLAEKYGYTLISTGDIEWFKNIRYVQKRNVTLY